MSDRKAGDEAMDAADQEFLESLRQEFLADSSAELDEWEQNLLDYEKSGAMENLNELKRLIHSMKGSTQAIGLRETAGFLHELEHRLLRAEESNSRREIVSLGLAFVDLMRAYLDAIASGESPETHAERLRALLAE